jgi:hypothetical protein
MTCSSPWGLEPYCVDATGGVASPPLAPRRLPPRRPLTMITYRDTIQFN